MPDGQPKKTAYLFGAGATHAELQNIEPELINEKRGLLIKDVSSRVIEKARAESKYLKDVAMVSGTGGSLNIELLISLIENSKIHGWEYKTRRLKKLVQDDIEKVLVDSRTRRFYLHKALLELHEHAVTQAKEQLIALISLNYDNVLDHAYEENYGRPHYCFSLGENPPEEGAIPLLKLHGSFNWKRQNIRGRRRTIEIIPLGSTKNYLHAPYGFIWNQALETLIECDTLRVIGCSLSPNDAHLIDLLFKAHLERGTAFDIEIIGSDQTGRGIRGNYGFFPRIRTLQELEEHLVPDADPPNPFKTWLKYKAIAMLGDEVKTTRACKEGREVTATNMPTKSKPRITRELKPISVKDFIDDYIYRIDLDADYQREKIWSREDQEKLIDSIIQNIDIPKIYLARVDDNENFDYECIDGKQRMTTLLSFFKPEKAGDNPLTVRIAGDKYTYKQLNEDLPKLARKLEEYELTFVIYPEIDDEEFLREIFRRLQLGVRLNSGELLKSHTGTIRDFIYKEMGKDAPFLRLTNLSEKRFSRQFTLAQICINSFSRSEAEDFVRARYENLEDFFKEKYNLDKKDPNLVRIREVLEMMDDDFGAKAKIISSRAVAVSAYLFVEELYENDEEPLVPQFADFYVALLEQIKDNLKLLSEYEKPTNPTVLEEFQKYISQASVESHAIKRRNLFLQKAFKHYLDPKTKGKIIGGK